MFDSVVKLITGWVRLRGATDDTFIGNTGDKLKVDASGTVIDVTADEEKTFSVLAEGATLNTNKSMISIFNAGGSGVIIKIRELRIYNVQQANITGVISDMALYRITGHSVGTSLTSLTHDTLDTLSGSVTARTGATVAGEAAEPLRRWLFDSDEISQGGLNSDTFQQTLAGFFPYLTKNDPQAKALTLRPGEGFTIKQRTTTTVGSFDFLIIFTEEPV